MNLPPPGVQILRPQHPALPKGVVFAFSGLIPGKPRQSLGWAETPGMEDTTPARRSWLAALGFDPKRAAFADQVHKAELGLVEEKDAGKGLLKRADAFPGTDGLMSLTKGIALSVTTADCLPVLLSTITGEAVVALHLGWRSLAGGLLEKALDHMKLRGLRPETVVAVLGPCISQEIYEVSEDFYEHFHDSSFLRRRDGKPHFSLKLEARRRLLKVGVPAAQVVTMPWCTYLDAGMFFSNRREGGVRGLLLSTVGRVN